MTATTIPRPAPVLRADPLASVIAEPADDVAMKQLVIVNWSGELDRIWPTLILATSAAASGVQCKVFITFFDVQDLPFFGSKERALKFKPTQAAQQSK